MVSSLERSMTVDPKTLRVAIYARRSCAEEGGKNKSAEEQIRNCTEFARFFGYDVDNARVFAEPDGTKSDWWWAGSNGPLPHRPKLSELMGAVDRGEVDVILTWRLDRLARDNKISVELGERLRSKKIRLHAGTRTIDLESADGEFAFISESAANTKYRRRISEDIIRDHEFKAQMGMFSRNPTCFGFRSRGKGSQAVEPVLEELATVRNIFSWFVNGDGFSGPLGLGEIARKLMGQGVRVRGQIPGYSSRLPDLIEHCDVQRILTNCMYVAKWRHNGVEHDCDRLLVADEDGKPGPVVPRDLYDQAQARLSGTRIKGKRALASDHLLTGIVVCGTCGRPMGVNPRRRLDGSVRKTFICNNKATNKQGACIPFASVAVQEEVVEAWVMEHLLPDLKIKIEETLRDGRDGDERELIDLEHKLARAVERETSELMSIVGVLDSTQVAALAQRLRSERESIARRVSDLRLRINAKDGAFPDLSDEAIQQMPKRTLKNAIRQCVKFIALAPEGLVVCDAWDGYVGARWINGFKCFRKRDTRRSIDSPTLETALTAPEWILNPEMFVEGRRFALGRSALHQSDEELFPGIEAMRVKRGETPVET
jgi:site-specific DNA recombinase